MSLIRPILFSTVILLFCSYYAFAQEADTTNYRGSKGEFYLLNWSPPPGKDGPQLQEVILQYDYNVKESQPLQRFNLSWKVGGILIVDGVTHRVETVGEEVFEEVTIESITFVAKVYSKGTYKGEVTIAYPNIIPRSGGESGWYMVGGTRWEDIFDELDAASAKEIFDGGFVLKDAQIHKITFGPGKELATLLEEPKEDVAPPATTRERSTDDPDHRKFIETAMGKLIMDQLISKRANYEGLPWYFGFHVDGMFQRFPINVNSTSQVVSNSGTATEFESSSETGGGYFVSGTAEGWPFFGQYFGAGLGVHGSYGGLPNLFEQTNFEIFFRQYIGEKEIKLLVELSKSFRSGTYKDVFSKTLDDVQTLNTITGNLNLSINRIGLGPRIWVGGQTMHNIDILVIMDQMVDTDGISKWAFGWRFEFWKPKGFRAALQFSSVYPAAGDLEYALSSNYRSKGAYFQLSATKSFDFFSRPLLLQRFRTAKWK